jgi:hypothetical protein
MWEFSDVAGVNAAWLQDDLTLPYGYLVAVGRAVGFFAAMIVLILITSALGMIVDELLIRKILKPAGADFGKYELQNLKRETFMPFR